ncbi:MAG: tetratricopeptide repeat protein [Acidobacteriia bacterium]|nr:tetratricopeptide repeat protein [Terriglobia bacterium]
MSKFAFLSLALLAVAPAQQAPRIVIDYPEEGSIFPPDFAPPTFLWRDSQADTTAWEFEIAFSDGAPAIHRIARGERMSIGEIDPRCVAESNELPKLTPEQAAAHTWKPDASTWSAIKQRSAGHPATVTITGSGGARGQVRISTSTDPVGAPIFYRDVPLMPSELEKGVIKPIIPSAVPLVGWRLRNVAESSSRLVMEGLPTCANCHSFSKDGKTMGMDVDGPQNDKGMYTIASVAPRMSIRSEDVFTWNDFPDKPPGHRTIGFMAQLSPDGRYAVTTVNEDVFVANFKDYRFLQVFYPTRGILAWYDRSTKRIRALPGADNPSFVQTNGFWSPDGKYLVFARAVARDAYPEGRKMAQYAGDPLEPPIQYDLYRIPFNGGKGGRPKAIAGASKNRMSNAFPKVSPDNRWIVFVESRNGQLMRPDGQLFIVPSGGGQARRMRCNTARMNSWHSFSPNGRWLVFSSKSRSPYTQMFLTHIDEEGNDSPAILIENSTAANRAVNIPEFVNIPADGLEHIDVPAAEFYRLFDRAVSLAEKGRFAESIEEWTKALAISPDDAKAQNNIGRAYAGTGDFDQAIVHWQRAIEINPRNWEAHNNLGVALAQKGKLDEAIRHLRQVLEANPDYAADVHGNLGRMLALKGKSDAAIAEWRQAIELRPNYAEAYNDLGTELSRKGRTDEALAAWQRATEVNPGFAAAHFNLGNALDARGRGKPALAEWRSGLAVDPNHVPTLRRAAWLLATDRDASLRNGAEAVALAERAVRLTADQDASVLDGLAAAYAEAGRFADAVETGNRAQRLAAEQGKRDLSAEIKARVGLYEEKVAYREGRN